MGAFMAPIINLSMVQNQFQYIIIGAGCAGLQLAKALLEQSSELVSSILIIDADKVHQEKSWCFWYDQNHQYRHLVRNQWSHVEFVANSLKVTEDIHPQTYQYINSLDFHQYHLNLFEKDDRIKVVYQHVNEIIPNNKINKIITENDIYFGEYIFHTNLVNNLKSDSYPKVWQHFLGWEIETENPFFDTNKATIMDFSLNDTKDIQFFYILPFSETRALVECTFFSKHLALEGVYEILISKYLSAKLNCNFIIKSKEIGKIPMHIVDSPNWQSDTIVPIGTAAGCIKPSTGYSFSRVMQHTKEIINAIKLKEKIPLRRSKPRFLFYDKLFLHIIDYESFAMNNIFYSLFKNNKITTILKFLDEKTMVLQECLIFLRLPKKPFLKAILKSK